MNDDRSICDIVARDIIGHESEAVSRVYTHIDFQTKLDAIDKLADVRKGSGAK